MIITFEDIKAVRPFANNIPIERVNVYIEEAEHLDIMRVVGVDLYQRFTEGDNLTEQESLMLNGGYYDASGRTHYLAGVKKALAYFAYARIVRNNQVNVTPYGVVTKIGEESTTTDTRTVAAVAAEAQNIGEALLAEAMAYWRNVTEACKCGDNQKAKRKFIAI